MEVRDEGAWPGHMEQGMGALHSVGAWLGHVGQGMGALCGAGGEERRVRSCCGAGCVALRYDQSGQDGCVKAFGCAELPVPVVMHELDTRLGLACLLGS